MALTDEQRDGWIRLVDDVTDATSIRGPRGDLTPGPRTSGALIDALLEAGWIPPT